MRAKVISQPGIDSGEPSVRSVSNIELQKPLSGDPEKTASENDYPATDYGRRVLQSQSSELNDMFKKARVRDALERQGYDEESIKTALKEIF
jgi:hypothetical protein